MKSFKQYTKLQEWTISDVQIAMKKKYGKIDTKAIEKLKKVQHLGNVDRNALVKVGHGKLHVECVELGEGIRDFKVGDKVKWVGEDEYENDIEGKDLQGQIGIIKTIKKFGRFHKGDIKFRKKLVKGVVLELDVIKESVELDEKSFLKKIKMDKFSRSERKRKKDIHKKAKEYNRKILGIESTELDEAWTADSVMKNAKIGSTKGYGITIKKTGGVTKTPYKHMLMTTRPHKNVRVTFDHGKDEFEGTPQSVALYVNKKLGIKESVELDEANLIVSFKTKEMMFERIYERDLKLKFKNLFRSVKQVKPNASFDITFKGEENELKKVAKYITGTLDRKNRIYDNHHMSNVATKRIA